jgi:ABC-2 type transport system ATP-binding protein
MSLIEVKDLAKVYKIPKRQAGMLGALKSIFKKEYTTKTAVQGVSFSISAGEMVGYIGPNGAGKSTTIKMLTGILVPTSGKVLVNGLIPYKERQKNARQIGVVFGQRTQLWWDLPTQDSFELLKQVYQIPTKRYKQNMDTYNEILGLHEFLHIPVRQLSLGQRMRADIAASLLHDPIILFLDEPTIGLDVVAKSKIRKFIREINIERKVTVILTTHDMADIEKLCKRMILIDNGKLMYDGELAKIKEMYGDKRIMVVDLEGDAPLELEQVTVLKEENSRKWLKFDARKLTPAELISKLSQHYEIKDLTIKDQDIEVIIRHLYERKEKR